MHATRAAYCGPFHFVVDTAKVTVLNSVPLSTNFRELEMFDTLHALIYVLAAFCVALLFMFAYLLDKVHGPLVLAAMMLWVWNMQPAEAQPVFDESQSPTIQQPMVWVAKAYNIYGDKVLLAANMCVNQEHQHVYAIYNSHGAFISGGCWKYDPQFTKRTGRIEYFDMSGAGWDSWPVTGFKSVPQQ